MTDSEEVLVHIGQCCLVPGVDEDIHTDTAWEGQIISMGCIFIHVKGLLRKNSMRTRKKTGIGVVMLRMSPSNKGCYSSG